MRARTDLPFSYDMSYLKRHREVVDPVPPPPRFAARTGREVALPVRVVRELGPLHAALGGRLMPRLEPRGLTEVATQAHHTLGLLRYEPTDAYPLHRGAPSPRCLYASELTYVSLGGEVLPRGLYRYHPARHSLVERPLPDADFLEREVTRGLEGASDGWLVSTRLARIAYRYGAFATRLALLEAGHVLCQLRLVSRALGLPTRVRSCWGDAGLARGLEEGETPLAFVSHRPAGEDVAPEGTASPAPDALGVGLREALLRRSSAHGSSGVYPVPRPVSAAELATLGWYALEEGREAPVREVLGLTLYLVVLQGRDVRPGVYRWSPEERAAHWLHPLPAGVDVPGVLFLSPGFAVRHCPVVGVVAADVRSAFRTWGEEGYFRVLEQTGRVAQRVALSAAALGLFARPAVGLDEVATDRLLGLHLARETALYTLLVGKDREPGFPVRLAL